MITHLINNMIILTTYWILTTIIAVRWVIKNPSSKFGDHDQVHFTLLEVAGKIFPCALVGWIAVPIGILHSIKFKR
jgi:hypothetical protein